MKPVNVFQLEIAGVFANKRYLLFKLGYAYILGLPFALVSMPQTIRIMGVSMVILFTSFLGAASTLVARRNDGHLGRLKLMPVPRKVLYGDFILSGAFVDTLQVSVVILLLLLVNARVVSAPLLLWIYGSFILTVFVLNVFGMLLGAICRTGQEVYLLGGFALAAIGFLSGLYPVSGPLEGFVLTVSRFTPLGSFRGALLVSMGAAATPREPWAPEPWAPAVWAAGIVLVLVLFGLRSFPPRRWRTKGSQTLPGARTAESRG